MRNRVPQGLFVASALGSPDYIGQILGGKNPGEIPIYQEAQFELLLNRKNAKALGLTSPSTLLAHADEVIE
jgi:putative ABC transport system substrate-binding protein